MGEAVQLPRRGLALLARAGGWWGGRGLGWAQWRPLSLSNTNSFQSVSSRTNSEVSTPPICTTAHTNTRLALDCRVLGHHCRKLCCLLLLQCCCGVMWCGVTLCHAVSRGECCRLGNLSATDSGLLAVRGWRAAVRAGCGGHGDAVLPLAALPTPATLISVTTLLTNHHNHNTLTDRSFFTLGDNAILIK